MIHTDLQKQLLASVDPAYKTFHCGLMPTVDPTCVLGVRVPVLRKLAKNFPGSAEAFMQQLPHRYYEENNLHAILISNMREFNCPVSALERFLPFVDNWATLCDMLAPKAFYAHPKGLLELVSTWIGSEHTYTIRFGIGVLLRYYLDEHFDPILLQKVSYIRSDEYYVNMMIAWYFATALAKQYASALPYLTERKLPSWVHNKTIQKANESYRVTREQKDFLCTLRYK